MILNKEVYDKKSLVTVLVLAKDVERYIERCLKSIFLMDYKNIEVIILDSHSSDNTCLIAKEFPVKIIKMNKASIPRAYNQGINIANGSYVFIVNGDSTVSKSFLKEALDVLNTNTRIAVVSGCRKQHITDNIITSLYQFRFLRLDTYGDVSSIGGNYIFNKRYYKQYIRKLNENQVANEEKVICSTFKKEGLKIIRIREISMTHLEDNMSIFQYWKKHIWYATGKASMLVNNHKVDKDFLISLIVWLSLFDVGKYVAIGTFLLIFSCLYISSINDFSKICSLKMSIIETISTFLRTLLLPILIILEYIKKLYRTIGMLF